VLYRPVRLLGVLITAIILVCCSAEVITVCSESVLWEPVAVAKLLGVTIVATTILLLLKLSEGFLVILGA
jgi:type IV secretory pathway VirB3-like protein